MYLPIVTMKNSTANRTPFLHIESGDPNIKVGLLGFVMLLRSALRTRVQFQLQPSTNNTTKTFGSGDVCTAILREPQNRKTISPNRVILVLCVVVE